MKSQFLMIAASLLASGTAHAAWQKAESQHFVVYSDDTLEHVREFTTRLEKFDKAIRVWHQAPEDVRGPSARVTVFQVGDIGAIQKLGGDNIAGFYQPRAGSSIAFVPRNSGEGADYGMRSESILFHEYTHHWMLTNWTDAALPPWYVEGAAELHATAQFRNDGVTFGAPPLYRGYTVDNSNLLPAERLIRPNPGKLNNLERDALYSRGWLLADYLTFDPERRKQLGAYLAAINAGKSGEEAAQALGGTSGLDLKLNSYVNKIKRSYPYFTAPNAQLTIGEIKVRTLTKGEAAIIPAYILSNRGVSEKSAPQVAAMARTVAAQYPSDAFVQNELAEAEYDVCSVDKKSVASCYNRAEAAADRAIAADPKSVHALVYKGMAREAAAKKDKVTDAARWSAIRKLYLNANRVDPDAPEPLIRFYASFQAANIAPSVSAENGLLYAYQLAPYDLGVRMSATRVLLGQDKPAQARTALAPVAFFLDTPGAATPAQKVLAALDKDGAKAALAELTKAEDEARKKAEDGDKPGKDANGGKGG